jgi:hypothetical protein
VVCIVENKYKYGLRFGNCMFIFIKINNYSFMELTSIENIRDVRDEIREQIKSLNFKQFEANKFGNEQEYTFKGLIGGIESLLTDISTLTKAPNKFVKISTYDERNQILNSLRRINIYLESPVNFIPQFEALKVLLRSYNVRNFSERQIEFEKEIENVRKIKLDLQQVFSDSKSIIENIDSNKVSIIKKMEEVDSSFESIEEELEKIIVSKDNLITESQKLKSINLELTSIKENAEENLDEIVTATNESKSNEKLISSFAQKVQERDKRLVELEQNTNENNEKLLKYESERKSILDEAKTLIESAKKALNYKTAEGISESFQLQYITSNDKIIFGSWILGAFICLLGTVGLGIWILHESSTSLGILIGRISLLPLPIIGAIFCANQYTKQKNIKEDYAYKMVLSKAIVGFSEQLKRNGTESNEEYIHYIKTALEEIHKDPLRKRESLKQKSNDANNTSLKDLVEVAERIIKMSKLD